MNKIKRTFNFRELFLLGFLTLGCLSALFAENSSPLSGSCKGYNVLLIVADALRPDYLGCYGCSDGITPSIDELAGTGSTFRNAFCQIPLTLPSFVSLLTSLYPYSHNVIVPMKDGLSSQIQTFPEVLKEYGYRTVWIGYPADLQTGSAKGLTRGFDILKDIAGRGSPSNNENLFQMDATRDVLDFSTVVGEIGRLSALQKPFFLLVHSYLPHEKFFPRYRFKNMFTEHLSSSFTSWLRLKRNQIKERMFYEDRKALCALLSDSQCAALFHDEKSFSTGSILIETDLKYSLLKSKISTLFFDRLEEELLGLDPWFFSEYLSLLKSAIYELDRRLIGQVIKTLKRKGLLDKTVIILTADHGNEYREHGHIGHGRYVYDESVRIPLVVFVPGYTGSQTVDAFVETIDIAPTILDLLAIPVPGQMQGESLLHFLSGTVTASTKECVYSQSVDGKLSVRNADWKFIVLPDGRNELFNMMKDPKELENLSFTRKEEAIRLRHILNGWKKQLMVYDQRETSFSQEIDVSTQKRLMNTGYW